MMRLLKIFSLAVFIAAAALFGAAEAIRYMNRDTTLPVLSAASETLEIPCAYHPEQLLEGVTASDEKDGDLTSQILVGNFSRFIEPGLCDLTYVVFDSSEHMATLTRRVVFTDYHSPRFSLSEPLCFDEGSTNTSEVRTRFSAYDVLDGDLTSWITYIETDAAYNKPGSYSITMEIRNSFGDTVSYAFPIHITEKNTQNIEIRLTDGLVYIPQGSAFSPLDYVESVRDGIGRDYSTDQLMISSQVDPSTPGLYEVHYQFSDDSDLSGQVWLTVIVEGASG